MRSMATRDEDRFRTLKKSLVDLDPFRRGTVLLRFIPCGKAGCRCQANPPKLHGPYYDWSRKVRGKTVTVRLTKQQARLLKQWIANARRLDRIVADMERVSYRITERLFQAVRKPPRD
jgi:integrase